MPDFTPRRLPDADPKIANFNEILKIMRACGFKAAAENLKVSSCTGTLLNDWRTFYHHGATRDYKLT